jgi:hypothetical protein
MLLTHLAPLPQAQPFDITLHKPLPKAPLNPIVPHTLPNDVFIKANTNETSPLQPTIRTGETPSSNNNTLQIAGVFLIACLIVGLSGLLKYSRVLTN